MATLHRNSLNEFKSQDVVIEELAQAQRPANPRFHTDERTILGELESSHSAPTRPNRWSTIKRYLREPAAEFLGTMILVIFGTAANCQTVLSTNTRVAASPQGNPASAYLGWGAGIAMGAWVSSGVSGGHINPAITIALAVFRGFSWRKVPVYILSQVSGALCGAAIVYGNYFHAIDIYEGGAGVRTVHGPTSTAGLFGTYALDYMTSASSFFSEFLGAAILMLVVLAVTDKRNGPPPAGLVPLALFFTLLGISACLGMETSFAINPARDFGPRVLTAMAGYGQGVFTYRSHYWLWCPIIAPICGALVAAGIYDAFIFEGEESIFNQPWKGVRSRFSEPRVSKGSNAV